MKRVISGALKKSYAQTQLGCAIVNEQLFHNFELKEELYTEEEALKEAKRCFNCSDPQCMAHCPSSVNVPKFIYALTKRNYYGAAKAILSANPCGFSCGQVCPTENLCSGHCIQTENPINIKRLQAFAINKFKEIYENGDLTQIVDDSIEKPKKHNAPIALIGCGPTSISCATFLSRLGYDNITIFERQPFGGGLLASELPEFRLPVDFVNFEVQLLKDLGVKFEFGKELGKDFTIEDLKKDFEAVYVGIGKPDPIRVIKDDDVRDSKEFLSLVSEKSKCGQHQDIDYPDLTGHVVVLGAGDTAMDCVANSARLNADKVSIILRRDFSSMRANSEELEGIINELSCGCNFITNAVVKDILRDEEGKLIGLELYRTVETMGDDADMGSGLKKSVVNAEEQTFKMYCDHVISAFGTTLNDQEIIDALSPIEVKWGTANVDSKTRSTEENPWLFAGGDFFGSGTAVEAIGDGKVGAWRIHEFLTGKKMKKMEFPDFRTQIDNVDLSVDFCGLKFESPFGLASAPHTGTIAQVERAFQAGWSFVVTKTVPFGFQITNVSPRISKGNINPDKGQHLQSFVNIDMYSEKNFDYYINMVKKLKKKKKYNGKKIIFGVTCHYDKLQWQDLVKQIEEAGADGIELSLSCPHGEVKIGESPELIEDVVSWVKEVTDLPVFVKMSPNVTDIVKTSEGAKLGHANGVTCINTVSALSPVQAMGIGYPHAQGATTYGGLSGNAIHPIMLKAVSEVYTNLVDENFRVMGVGGIDNSEKALGAMLVGADLVQVCSAVQNHSFDIIDDMQVGLKALLYIFANQNNRYTGWDGQSSPKQKIENEKEELIDVPRINDVVGYANAVITSMDNIDPNIEKHCTPKVDVDLCVGCGKCFIACRDSAQYAIAHKGGSTPRISDDNCFGCGLCATVCPTGAITMVVREDSKYVPKRD